MQLQKSFELVVRVFQTNQFQVEDTSIVLEALETVSGVCADLAEKLREMSSG